LVYSAQRALRNDPTISDERKLNAERSIRNVQQAMEQANVRDIHDAMIDLTMVVHDLTNKYHPVSEPELAFADDSSKTAPHEDMAQKVLSRLRDVQLPEIKLGESQIAAKLRDVQLPDIALPDVSTIRDGIRGLLKRARPGAKDDQGDDTTAQSKKE